MLPLCTFLAAAVIFCAIKAFNEETRKRLFVLGKFSFAYMVLNVIVIGGLKELFGRQRYVDIIAGEGAFSAWYNPNFFGGGSSFPSGHVAGACGMLVFLLIFYLFPSQKKYKKVWIIASFVFIGLVGLSRLIMGKHFLSDITASVIIMTLLFMALTALFEKRGWLKTMTQS